MPVLIFAGAMLGFTLARFSYLNISGTSSSSYRSGASPGEWYHYRTGHYRVGITLHLVAIITAGFLAVWQFVPVIRHKALLLHRINGYIVILLALIGNAGALMIARRAFGGGLDIQSAVGVLAIITTLSLTMAYCNIKRLQIDQHRAWMLRAWFYFGTIITTRIIMIISALIISRAGDYYQSQTCGEVAFIYHKGSTIPQSLSSTYPACINGTANTEVLVNADFSSSNPEQIGAALRMSFGMGLWLSIFLHAVGIEIYLRMTPAESERLRMKSYERQLEAGYKNPGSAGLTVGRFGDAQAWQADSIPH